MTTATAPELFDATIVPQKSFDIGDLRDSDELAPTIIDTVPGKLLLRILQATQEQIDELCNQVDGKVTSQEESTSACLRGQHHTPEYLRPRNRELL